MRIDVQYRTYRGYGGHATLRLAGQFVTTHLEGGDYGLGWDVVEFVACCRTLGPPTRTLDGIYDEFHAWRDTLPKASPRRSEDALELAFKAIAPLADEIDRGDDTVLSLGLFRRTLGKLPSLVRHLTPRDRNARPDLEALTRTLERIAKAAPSTLQELAQLYLDFESQRQATSADS